MPITDVVLIDDDRTALITPFFSLDVSAFDITQSPEMAINVALCELATVNAFASKSVCHGDLKPSNMMPEGGNQGKKVVTIDFGSSVPYNQSIEEITWQFGLDCPAEGSLQYDLNCLAVTIVGILSAPDAPVMQETTRSGFLERIADKEGPAYEIAKMCLQDDLDLNAI